MNFSTIKSRFFFSQEIESELEKLIGRIEEEIHSNSFIAKSLDRERTSARCREINVSSPISGKIFAIKDLISNTDGIVTGGSKFLEEYRPPFNSTIYKELKEKGAINIVNANLDEFGLGATGLSSGFGVVRNPIDEKYISGGSSSGSAYLIAKKLIEFSIVSDTGDSARLPASSCGIVGFKPSFGKISRFGFFPFCSGFDTPSIMSGDIKTIADVFSAISFADSRDLCTLSTEKMDYSQELSKPLSKKIRVAIIADTFWRKKGDTDGFLEIKDKFDEFLTKIRRELGLEVQIYDFPTHLLRLSSLIYMIVSSVESISNYANYTGLLFPFKWDERQLNFLKKDNGSNFEEIVRNNRTAFGDEFVFRQIMGGYFIDGENYKNIYVKSKKLLSKINGEVEKMFEECDIVISPSCDDLPDEIDSYRRQYSPSAIKSIMLLANFASLPAISIPWQNVKNMPVGLHIMGNYGKDEVVLNFANHIVDFIGKV